MSKMTEIITYTTPDGNEIRIPVAKVKGSQQGPNVLITAGIHGCEYPGIVAATRFFQELQPDELSGEITIITICSLQAFEKRSPFVNPADGKNPNRTFPGNLAGSYSDVQAYHIFNDFISKADFHLDLHGGDLVEALVPFSIYHGGEGNKTEQLSRELAEYYGLPHIVMTTSDGAWNDSGTTYANAAKTGVPSAIVEAGGIGQLDKPSVDSHLNGLRNVMRYLKCIKGTAVKPSNLQFYRDFLWVRSTTAGIFIKEVEIGDTLHTGQKIGQVEDYFGNKLTEIISPADGNMLFLTTSPAIAENGLILGVGII